MQLRCNEWDAAGLLTDRLDEILPVLDARQDVFVVVSLAGVELAFGWGA